MHGNDNNLEIELDTHKYSIARLSNNTREKDF
jgi:hypothetical protein